MSFGRAAQRMFEPDLLAQKTTAIVLAGGKGRRLGSLTRHVCKPALPFGGLYRNIDFSLANCINSGIDRIGVATQYKGDTLVRHMARVWRDADSHSNGFIDAWQANSHADNVGYCGTADAVYQNWEKIEGIGAPLVLVLAGDHVYKMDYRPMLERHQALGADVTVGCVKVPIAEASQFGIMAVDSTDRIVRFSEKPRQPESLSDQSGQALASMGIYVFNRELLGRLLDEDALAETSSHDFGRDLLPAILNRARVFAFPFTDDAVIGGGYWRDVGTVSTYWRAHMELLDGIPGFDLRGAKWPVRSGEDLLITKRSRTVHGLQPNNIVNSLLVRGCEVNQATVCRSVISANVKVAPHVRLSNAVVLPNVVIGRNCRLTDVVIESGVCVPDGTVVPPARDRGDVEPTLVTSDLNVLDPKGERCQQKRIQSPSSSYTRWNRYTGDQATKL